MRVIKVYGTVPKAVGDLILNIIKLFHSEKIALAFQKSPCKGCCCCCSSGGCPSWVPLPRAPVTSHSHSSDDVDIQHLAPSTPYCVQWQRAQLLFLSLFCRSAKPYPPPFCTALKWLAISPLHCGLEKLLLCLGTCRECLGSGRIYGQ